MNQPPVKLPITTPIPRGYGAFITGVSAFMAGMKQVMPGGGLFRFALAPVVISGVVLVGLAAGAFFLGRSWFLEWFDATWLAWLGGVLAFIIALVLAYFFFTPVMTIFGPLFMDPICERVHVRYTGAPLTSERGGRRFIKRQFFAFVQAIKWTLVVLLIELPLAILALVTFVGAVVAVPVSSVLQGVDLMDYPLAIKDRTLSEKIEWARANFWACVGLGAGASVCLLVPVLNFFVVPAGAAGATLLLIAAEGGNDESLSA